MSVSTETLRSTLEQITPPDAAAGSAAQRELDLKTKPRGSLGELETIVCRIASVRGTGAVGRLRAALVLAAGDHGVAAEGVSAYPQEVTRQMLANFAAGGAAVSVLAREVGAQLVVVDAGVTTPSEYDAVRDLRLGPGTANFTRGPAMSREQACAGLEAGIGLAGELAGQSFGLVAVGDMGIGNTTAASALCAALLPAAP
jgi:nicotinate-nucleotide--dimethylbenzimidazole phosphoribosyltransferase